MPPVIICATMVRSSARSPAGRAVVVGSMRPGLKRAVQLNGTTGLCITKLDVLDGLPRVMLNIGYTMDGREVDILPYGADAVSRCEPVYEEFAGLE